MADRQRTLLETAEQLAEIGSWDWDVEGGGLVWSDNMFRLIGLEPGEVVPTIDLVVGRAHPDDRDALAALIEDLRVTGEIQPITYRIVRADGEVRRLRSTTTIVERRAGRPRRLVGAVQDLTDLYRADRNIAAHLAVSDALAEWDGLQHGVERLVERLGEALGCVVGMLWVPEGDALVVRRFWSSGTVDAEALEARAYRLRVVGDDGLVGRGWRLGEALSSMGLADQVHPAFRDAIVAMGLTSGVAVPAVHREEVLAVFVFYSTGDLLSNERLTRSLTGIGHELGTFLDRHRGALAPAGLTPREVEVLQLAADGRPVKAIAADLGVSPATVRTHFEHIYAKYGVSDRAAAVAMGMREGLVE
jgi:PAS domain S-box-containing protein